VTRTSGHRGRFIPGRRNGASRRRRTTGVPLEDCPTRRGRAVTSVRCGRRPDTAAADLEGAL